jgi:hypothetical protein
MEKRYSLYADAKRQIEIMRTYREATENCRKSIVQNQRFVPPEIRRETREECLQRVRSMVQNSERSRKFSDECRAAVDSVKAQYDRVKPRPIQKRFVVNVPAGASVVLVFG